MTEHPPRVTRTDLEQLALGRPPFVSMYVDMSADHRATLVERVAAIADGLLELGATPELVARVTNPFLAPPSDRSAMGVVTSSDGRYVIGVSPEPLVRDFGDLAAVPHLAPVIEWSQEMITHCVIRRARDGEPHLAVFGADGRTYADVGAPEPTEDELVEEIVAHDPAAVFVVGPEHESLLGRIRALIVSVELRPDCRVIELDDGTDEEVADAVVRHTASVVAERKVELLRDFRFERSHGQAVEGIDAVLDAVNSGQVSTLLLDADPDDHRRVRVRPDGTLELHQPADDGDSVPLTDAVVWATLARGGVPVVMPSTGERGPDDDLGAFLFPRPPAGIIDR